MITPEELIKKYLGHELDLCGPAEMAELRGLYIGIKRHLDDIEEERHLATARIAELEAKLEQLQAALDVFIELNQNVKSYHTDLTRKIAIDYSDLEKDIQQTS